MFCSAIKKSAVVLLLTLILYGLNPGSFTHTFLTLEACRKSPIQQLQLMCVFHKFILLFVF